LVGLQAPPARRWRRCVAVHGGNASCRGCLPRVVGRSGCVDPSCECGACARGARVRRRRGRDRARARRASTTACAKALARR
jgi:hypothetical protein